MRLAIVLSTLWMIFIGTIASGEREPAGVVFVGSFPLIVLWGVWWVIQGFRGRSTRPQTPPARQVCTLSPQSVANSNRRKERSEIAHVDDDVEVASHDAASRSRTRNSSPYILRLWRGDIGLGTTFWIWGFLVFLAFRGINALADRNLVALVPYMNWYYAFSAFSLAYGIFIWIAIWRSANNSPRSTGPGLAKLWVVLAVFSTVGSYHLTYLSPTLSTYSQCDISALADQLSLGLPTRMDEITVLDSITASDRTLTYTYTIESQANDELDQNMLKSNVTEKACAESDIAELVESDVSLNFVYSDSRGNRITSVQVNEWICSIERLLEQ